MARDTVVADYFCAECSAPLGVSGYEGDRSLLRCEECAGVRRDRVVSITDDDLVTIGDHVADVRGRRDEESTRSATPPHVG